jgi:GT2 family glycosyltransferase
LICVLGTPEGGLALIEEILGQLGVDCPDAGGIRAVDESLLEYFGGSWQTPPTFPDGWTDDPGLEGLRRRARSELAAAPRVAWARVDALAALTLPFWSNLLAEQDCILYFRDPGAVARSLVGHAGLPFEQGVDLWVTYLTAALAGSKERSCLVLCHEDLLAGWEPEARRLAGFLGRADCLESDVVRTAVEAAVAAARSSAPASGVTREAGDVVAASARALHLALRCARGPVVPSAPPTELLTRLDEREHQLAAATRTEEMLRSRLADQMEELDGVRQRLARLEANWFWWQRNSAAWRLLTLYRHGIEIALPAGTRRRRLYHVAVDGVRILKAEGARAFLRRTSEALASSRPPGDPDDVYTGDPNALPACSPQQYRLWMRLNQPSPVDLERMRAHVAELGYRPLMSLCLPVYDPDEQHLTEVLASIRQQVYDNWELIVVDDGSTRSYVQRILAGAVEADTRIRVAFKERNEGIPRTLNQAFAQAQGEFLVVVDHDDIVEPHALYEVTRFLNTRDPDCDLIYSDEALIDSDGRLFHIAFRPDFSPEFLLSHPYIVHLVAVRRSALTEVGGCDETFPNVSWDYDLWLRVTARTKKIGHIPKVLYRWRRYRRSASHREQKLVMHQSKLALAGAMRSMGLQGTVEDGLHFNFFRVRPELRGERVSVIIPTRSPALVERCIRSLEANVKYPRYEIVVVANNLPDLEARRYFETLSQRHRVLFYEQSFNFSAINNYAARLTEGEHLLFLNDDTEMVAGDSLEAMLELSQREELGAVGAKLLYPNRTIQHAGVLVGFFGSCDHFQKFHPGDDMGYLGSLVGIRNFSAVTAACMMVRRRIFEEVGGFDEALRVVFNDVDLCLRIRSAGYRVVYTPYAVFVHHEHVSRRGSSASLLPVEDDLFFKERWRKLLLQGDPYYNPNLSQWHYDCRPRFDTW